MYYEQAVACWLPRLQILLDCLKLASPKTRDLNPSKSDSFLGWVVLTTGFEITDMTMLMLMSTWNT